MSDTINDSRLTGQDLAALFRRASRLMARVYHRRDHAHHAQSHVLDLLRERGPVSQRDLLEELDVRSSSLSEVLRKLELGGWITRERNPEDRRGFVISATERTMASVEPDDGAEGGQADLFACLNDEERTSLRDILTKLTASLSDDPLAGEPGFGRGGPGRGRGKGPGRGMGKGRGMENGRGMGKGRGMGRGRRG